MVVTLFYSIPLPTTRTQFGVNKLSFLQFTLLNGGGGVKMNWQSCPCLSVSSASISIFITMRTNSTLIGNYRKRWKWKYLPVPLKISSAILLCWHLWFKSVIISILVLLPSCIYVVLVLITLYWSSLNGVYCARRIVLPKGGTCLSCVPTPSVCIVFLISQLFAYFSHSFKYASVFVNRGRWRGCIGKLDFERTLYDLFLFYTRSTRPVRACKSRFLKKCCRHSHNEKENGEILN